MPLSGTTTDNVKRLRGFVALELLLIATVVSVVAENPKPHGPCKLSPTTFDGWNAEELSSPWVELVIVPQLGTPPMPVTFTGGDCGSLGQTRFTAAVGKSK